MNDTTAVERQQQVADTFRGIADALTGVADFDLTGMYVHLTIQPGGRTASDDEKITTIDAVANAVLGKPGQTEGMSNGTYHHGADDRLPGGVYVSIYNSVTNPAERDLHAELRRLRAALADREAAAGHPADAAAAEPPASTAQAA